MKLFKIEISNFKGLRENEFEPGSFSCLVGENNAGKSTFLQAIDHGLNLKTKLDSKVFYDEDKDIELKLYFSEVSNDDLERLAENHQQKIKKVIYDEDKFSFLLRIRHSESGEIKVLMPVPKDEKFRKENFSNQVSGKKAPELREMMNVFYPEVEMPEKVNQGEVKKAIADYVAKLSANDLVMGETTLETGIKESIQSLLPEPIYIPAVKNLDDDMKTSGGTSFSKIISLLLDDIKEDLEDFHKSMDKLNKKLNRYVDEDSGELVDHRNEKIKTVESLVESFLKQNFPHVKVELEIPPPQLKTILGTAKLWVDDGSKDQIDNKGDGIKRSLIFALLQTYVKKLEEKVDDESKVKPLMFLFEEPELYLHPKSQIILFNTLGRISKKFQVIVATHSAVFFAPGITAKFARVYKESANPKPIGRIESVNFDLEKESSDVFRLAKYEHAEAAFFSSSVVLFEGESDEYFIKHIAKVLNKEWDFDLRNISLVKCNGKGNFEKFKRFFESFKINVFVIGDLDCITGGFDKLMPSEDAIKEKSTLLGKLDDIVERSDIKLEVNSRKIKKITERGSWIDAYNELRESLKLEVGSKVENELIQKISKIFDWEKEGKRLKVLSSVEEAQELLFPLIKKLREEHIFILRKGAIEDYYPDDVPDSLPKPEKAIKAIDLISGREEAIPLSDLEDSKKTELEVIFEKIFNT